MPLVTQLGGHLIGNDATCRPSTQQVGSLWLHRLQSGNIVSGELFHGSNRLPLLHLRNLEAIDRIVHAQVLDKIQIAEDRAPSWMDTEERSTRAMRLQWNERRSSHIAHLLAQDLCQLAYCWILEQQSER